MEKKYVYFIGGGFLLLGLILLVYYYWLKKPVIKYTEQSTATGEKQYLLTYNYKTFKKFEYDYIYVNANGLKRDLVSVLVNSETFEKIKSDNKFNLIAE